MHFRALYLTYFVSSSSFSTLNVYLGSIVLVLSPITHTHTHTRMYLSIYIHTCIYAPIRRYPLHTANYSSERQRKKGRREKQQQQRGTKGKRRATARLERRFLSIELHLSSLLLLCCERHQHVQEEALLHTHTHIHIHIYIYIYNFVHTER